MDEAHLFTVKDKALPDLTIGEASRIFYPEGFSGKGKGAEVAGGACRQKQERKKK
ncbi:MAG: hypothetical protein NTW71_13275 [Deltaproteobacteria bacterium]|nr:hypothetical protein [Deltaproteobacteria bacterium]